MNINHLSERIIGCAIEVHRHLGPGLLESAYERCLCKELQRAQLLSYLKLSDLHLGLLMNFNETMLRNGIIRIANGDMPS